MKIIRLVLVVLFASAATALGGASGIVGRAQSGDEAAACRVLAGLAQRSNRWAEVIAYKNAFDFTKQHVRDRGSIAESERYFERLVQNNGGATGFYCMYLNKAPKENCGFRNHETASVLEAIEKKLKDDNISLEDIKKAVEAAKPSTDQKKYTPLKNQR